MASKHAADLTRAVMPADRLVRVGVIHASASAFSDELQLASGVQGAAAAGSAAPAGGGSGLVRDVSHMAHAESKAARATGDREKRPLKKVPNNLAVELVVQ